MSNKILVIDDEPDHLIQLEKRLGEYQFLHKENAGFVPNKEKILEKEYSAVLFDLDYNTPAGYDEGFKILPDLLKALGDSTPVIVMTKSESFDEYEKSIWIGASDFISKRNTQNWKKKIERAIKYHKLVQTEERVFEVGIEKTVRQCKYMGADYPTPLLITGAFGSGKNTLAEYIHRRFFKNHHKITKVNCKRSGQGVHDKMHEVIEEIKRESFLATYLFIDIEEADTECQSLLLDIVKENKRYANWYIFTSKKSIKEWPKNYLQELVERLEKPSFSIPPLTQRKEGIPSMVEYFLGRTECCPKGSPFFRKPVNNTMTDEAINELKKFPWEKNIRQLKKVVKQAVWKADRDGAKIINKSHLPERFSSKAPSMVLSAESQIHLRLDTIEDCLRKAPASITIALNIEEKILLEELQEYHKQYPHLFDQKPATRRYLAST